MKKTIKRIAFAIAISLPLFIVSCLDKTETTPPRTAETEQGELDYAIAQLESSGYDVDTTDLGVFYVMNTEGTGPTTAPGDTCSLIYTGYFLSGQVFDSSGNAYPDSIWQFNYMEVSLIAGFDNGIALLNKGAIADIIVPSVLAYGELGYSSIPPYTPLLFRMEMRDLKPVE